MGESRHERASLGEFGQVQGNILQPFEGRFQAFVFLSFGCRRDQARAWLGAAATRVDSPADTPMSVGLTATGLIALHPEVAADLVRFEAFWKGPLGNRFDERGEITSTPAMIGDVGASDPMSWLIGGPRRPPVDALLTLAADDEQALRQRVSLELSEAARAGVVVMPLGGMSGTGPLVQYGTVLHNADGRPIEHFGFVEGISQPAVQGVDGATTGSTVVAAGEFVLGFAGVRRPLNFAPRPAPAPWMRGGSFQVFRRLRQDAAGWWSKMEKLSDQDNTAEDVAARAIGRRLDGTPLAASGDGLNDFTFHGDEDGSRTPLYSHIRKMNPRRDEMFRERSHKLIRRGIPFGPPMDRDNPDDHERGMLFNAYMASIEDQFEFLQRCWANDIEFPSRIAAKFDEDGDGKPQVNGLDPVLGDSAEVAHRRLGTAVVDKAPPLAFGGFVTTTGSVYALVPSRAALHLLAGEAALDAPGVR
ncbi:Dyp-type peroxidase [Actinoplanes sp. HUAS TT8]|uniref:Dyp-type peroxidase n=1 Tax=Actinoplanes sp. HUAS TT8 TaxID=3447453 RepID=UPI003F528240